MTESLLCEHTGNHIKPVEHVPPALPVCVPLREAHKQAEQEAEW
jgi:hypothetical protein